MKAKPKVGDILYSLNINNAARNCEQKLEKVEVIKVGRIYFTCKFVGYMNLVVQYHLSDWREKTDYTPASKLYTYFQEWEDEKEAKGICREIYNAFEYGHNKKGISLLGLRQIKDLMVMEEYVNAN